jgi:hypothetical protein
MHTQEKTKLPLVLRCKIIMLNQSRVGIPLPAIFIHLDSISADTKT